MRVSHCYRETNFCTDALAKFGATSGGVILFKEAFPMFISHLSSRNTLGASIPKETPL